MLDVKLFRKVVTEACHKLNEQRLREKAGDGTKAKRIIFETYLKTRIYLKKLIENVRIQFSAKFGMLPFAGNYGHDQSLPIRSGSVSAGSRERGGGVPPAGGLPQGVRGYPGEIRQLGGRGGTNKRPEG